jgi:hypothetical protein
MTERAAILATADTAAWSSPIDLNAFRASLLRHVRRFA